MNVIVFVILKILLMSVDIYKFDGLPITKYLRLDLGQNTSDAQNGFKTASIGFWYIRNMKA